MVTSAPVSDFRVEDRQRHGEAAADQHRGIDGAERDVHVRAACDEGLRIIHAVHGECQEQSSEQHQLGHQKDPHAEAWRSPAAARGCGTVRAESGRMLSVKVQLLLQAVRSRKAGQSTTGVTLEVLLGGRRTAFSIPVRSLAMDSAPRSCRTSTTTPGRTTGGCIRRPESRRRRWKERSEHWNSGG